jgi:UDP-N-acetylmuramyl pentapeptide phosphotransferase/UDP-N-acetylglucosamine-1-phosphate transferase
MYAIVLFASLLTWLLLFPIQLGLRRHGIVDRPNARSSHSIPTVRGAGAAIVAVLAVATAWLAACGGYSLLGSGYSVSVGGSSAAEMAALLFAFVSLAVVSFIDDLKGLPARIRFLVQLGCAVSAVLILTTNNGQPTTISAATTGFAFIAAFWIAGYTNAFNFMDGINGIAGIQAFVTAIGTAMIAGHLGLGSTAAPILLCFVVAGSALGFLPHNFPRARVFMGDVGSAPLGFLLATLAFWIAELTSWWVLFWISLLHANFVLDCGITLVRRALRGDRLSEAHREHFYQRLVRAGYSHVFVALTEGALQVLVAIALWWETPSTLTANAEGRMQNVEGVKMLAVAAAIISVWLAFFACAEGVFRRSQVGSLGVRTDA